MSLINSTTGRLLLSLLFFLQHALNVHTTSHIPAKNCSNPPFAVPFGNVSTFSDSSLSVAYRGLETYIGGFQKISTYISTTTNNTFVPDGDAYCGKNPGFRSCIFYIGGYYSRDSSISWEEHDDKNGTVPFDAPTENWGLAPLKKHKEGDKDLFAPFPVGHDKLTFSRRVPDSADANNNLPDITLLRHPLTIIDNKTIIQSIGFGNVGLGSASTFLAHAVRSNLAPSRSWALDYGTTQPYRAGELVVGGYNPSKIDKASDFQRFPVFPNKSIECPLQLPITRMRLGEHVIADSPFVACLEPTVWFLVLPAGVQRRFNETLLNAHPELRYNDTTWEYSHYVRSSSSSGSESASASIKDLPPISEALTIDIANGPSVTVPASEMVAAKRSIDPKIGWVFDAGVHQVAMGDGGGGVGRFVRFGAPFLSQVYLAVDYEKGEFMLAPVKHGKAGGGGDDGGDGDRTASGRELRALGGCEGFEGEVYYLEKEQDGSRRMGTGKIVGSVVGALVLGALVAVGAWWFWGRGGGYQKKESSRKQKGMEKKKKKKKGKEGRYVEVRDVDRDVAQGKNCPEGYESDDSRLL